MVSAPEEPDVALARGAALASANAPLFASSTAALAYALDPGTGEVHPRGLAPTYLDISATARPGKEGLAYSAVGDEEEDDESPRRRSRFVLAGSALAAILAIGAGVGGFANVRCSADFRSTAQPRAKRCHRDERGACADAAAGPAKDHRHPSPPLPAAAPAPEAAPAARGCPAPTSGNRARSGTGGAATT